MSDAYLAEVAEQPRILAALAEGFGAQWGDALHEIRKRLARGEFDRIILTGMGGSLHGLYPAYLALSRLLPIPVLFWESGELTQQALNIVSSRSLVIAVSQSGESGELLRLTQSDKRPALAIAITNSGDNSLARWSDVAIATEAGAERTASTKTYTAGLAALHLVAEHLIARGDEAASEVTDVSRAMAALLPQMPALAERAALHLGASTPITAVGKGPSYASAAMAALLIEEAAKLSCEPLTGSQFRHGPFELVRDGFRAIVFLGHGEARTLLRTQLDRIAELGGRALAIGTAAGSGSPLVVGIDLPVVPPALLPIVEMIPIQFLVVPLAIARGFEPAAFINSRKVTTGE